MDICIPFRFWSPHCETDLRFCLRSIEKNFSGYNNIFLIGQKPKWVKNVTFIPFEDGNLRGANIFGKMLACPSEKFIAWFDDHYLLKPISEIKSYYSGTLTEFINAKHGTYKEILINTEKELTHLNKELLCYDSHTPCIFERKNLLELSHLNWNRPPSYALKTLYFNLFESDSEHLSNTKEFIRTAKREMPYLKEEIIKKDLTWISSADYVPPGFKLFLQDMFKEKSRYEV